MSMALCYQFRGVESTSALFPHQAGLASLGSVFRNGTWPSMLASSESDRVFRGHLEPESSRPNSCSPPSNGAKPPVKTRTGSIRVGTNRQSLGAHGNSYWNILDTLSSFFNPERGSWITRPSFRMHHHTT